MWWRKAMHMLGLEEEVPDHDRLPAREPERSARDRTYGREPTGPMTGQMVNPVSGSHQIDEPSGIGTVRPIRTGQTRIEEPPADQGPGRDPITGGSGAVRRVIKPVPMAPNAKPHVVRPESFDQAQSVADAYKINQPVIMDLQDASRELSRRLIDFASGLCYGLGGQMERLDSQVYLLTPTSVSISDEERRRLRDRGYDA